MIRGLILAAGSGSRFGQNKLLACLPNGQPIALASAMSMRGVVDGISAVLNPESETLTNLFLSNFIFNLNCLTLNSIVVAIIPTVFHQCNSYTIN